MDGFLKTIKPKESEITQLLQEDIDGDGNIEILASFGTQTGFGSDKFSKNYLLRQMNTGYANIRAIEGERAPICAVKLVKLDKTKIKIVPSLSQVRSKGSCLPAHGEFMKTIYGK